MKQNFGYNASQNESKFIIESIESKMSMMQIESKLGQIESKWVKMNIILSKQLESTRVKLTIESNEDKLSQIDSFYKIKLSSLRSL